MIVRRRTALSVLMVVALAGTAGERVAGAGDATCDQGACGRRSRWRGIHGGRRRHPSRHRRVAAWRQRRRRRRRGSGHAGRHRAVLGRYRRWRLPRLLRRPYQDGAHHRRPGGRASDHAARTRSSTPPPGCRSPSRRRASAASRSAYRVRRGPGRPRCGSGAPISLRDALRPAIKVADRGFVVDQTFVNQINENLAAFSQFSSTSAAVPAGRGAARGRLDLPQP